MWAFTIFRNGTVRLQLPPPQKNKKKFAAPAYKN